MMQLYMVEIHPDFTALQRFVKVQGIAGREDDTELGYGIHAWLGAAFGKLAPKPWRLLMDRRGQPRILAYSPSGAEALHEQIAAFADPCAAAVCSDPRRDIMSKAMPLLSAGRTVGFEVLCCPVVRKAGSGIEKDVFLAAADSAPAGTLVREAVYCEWAAARLQEGGALVSSVQLKSFRLVRQVRQTQKDQSNGRRFRQLRRPHAVFTGTLTVADPENFQRLLKAGVGRHRSFGYGMLLLRPLP
ncbi:MAG: type I-E CRISPR-associated protein Cas6/Cse3/CasE [Firmicutes bacterium]|nr:type I-E CRISPR-associated protein Cas6/Cse3/CasE [Bacillota bacterium]